jgi:hypothetical protein
MHTCVVGRETERGGRSRHIHTDREDMNAVTEREREQTERQREREGERQRETQTDTERSEILNINNMANERNEDLKSVVTSAT